MIISIGNVKVKILKSLSNCLKFQFFETHFPSLHIQGLYKDRHSYGRSTMSTQLVGVFNFPILKFEEGKSAPGVAFCSKGSVFRNGGVHPSGKPSNWFIFEIIVDC